MSLEIIIFITSILFGAFLYWRESQSNKVYRFFNKVMNSKELQMKPEDKKGFIFQQSVLIRLLFITGLFLVGIAITRILIPIDLATISLFVSMIFGTFAGTYLAQLILKSSTSIEERTDELEEKFNDVLEKGKDFIEDIKGKEPHTIEKAQEEIKEEAPKENTKSARERLKDKGYLK